MNCSICSSKAHFQCGNLCQTLYCNESCQIKDWNKNHAVECINARDPNKNKVKRGRGSNFDDDGSDDENYGGGGPFEEDFLRPPTKEQQEKFNNQKEEYQRRYLEQEKRTKMELEREFNSIPQGKSQMKYFMYKGQERIDFEEFYKNLMVVKPVDLNTDPIFFLDTIFQMNEKVFYHDEELKPIELAKYIWNFAKYQIENQGKEEEYEEIYLKYYEIWVDYRIEEIKSKWEINSPNEFAQTIKKAFLSTRAIDIKINSLYNQLRQYIPNDVKEKIKNAIQIYINQKQEINDEIELMEKDLEEWRNYE
jgi:hypothetical protein